jgi:regulator of replication initiation timing
MPPATTTLIAAFEALAEQIESLNGNTTRLLDMLERDIKERASIRMEFRDLYTLLKDERDKRVRLEEARAAAEEKAKVDADNAGIHAADRATKLITDVGAVVSKPVILAPVSAISGAVALKVTTFLAALLGVTL